MNEIEGLLHLVNDLMITLLNVAYLQKRKSQFIYVLYDIYSDIRKFRLINNSCSVFIKYVRRKKERKKLSLRDNQPERHIGRLRYIGINKYVCMYICIDR